jgi:regulator of protease activity HflC (stomatin/prohibitin superfamily)
VEALGEKCAQIEDAKRESASKIANALATAQKRLARAREESSEFIAINAAYAVAPAALAERLWFEVLEEILQDKRFALVDESLAEGPGGILLDQRGSADWHDPVPISQKRRD